MRAILIWIVAATLVAMSDVPGLALVVIVAAAFLEMRLTRDRTTGHALAAGITWLVLTIFTEIAMTEWLGHAWNALLGSPDRPLLRSLVLFAWVFAPLPFATLRNH